MKSISDLNLDKEIENRLRSLGINSIESFSARVSIPKSAENLRLFIGLNKLAMSNLIILASSLVGKSPTYTKGTGALSITKDGYK